MPGLADNLRRWRDVAEVDWFSQFIKAWIPFNAWMTDTYGDVSDREMLDKVKGTTNVVKNRIVPMLAKNLRVARDSEWGWQDNSADATDFRMQVGQLHRCLQECVVEGRKGRVSFETVDIGSNPNKDEQRTKRRRDYRVRRDHPIKGKITLEISSSQTYAAYALTLDSYDQRALEDDASFRSLNAEQRDVLLSQFNAVSPRLVVSVLAEQSYGLAYGDVLFKNDPENNFSALIEVLYGLRNALFHGAITPNETHNGIYKPAYLLAMRMVKCTI